MKHFNFQLRKKQMMDMRRLSLSLKSSMKLYKADAGFLMNVLSLWLRKDLLITLLLVEQAAPQPHVY